MKTTLAKIISAFSVVLMFIGCGETELKKEEVSCKAEPIKNYKKTTKDTIISCTNNNGDKVSGVIKSVYYFSPFGLGRLKEGDTSSIYEIIKLYIENGLAYKLEYIRENKENGYKDVKTFDFKDGKLISGTETRESKKGKESKILDSDENIYYIIDDFISDKKD